jgi:multidrug transporter EmrE-like cation transporter
MSVLIAWVGRRSLIGLAAAWNAGLLVIAIALAAPNLMRSAATLARICAPYSLALLVLAASLSFTVGGIFMKLSDGLTRPLQTVFLLSFFMVGACLQALAMRGEDLSAIYIIVLGVEAMLAFVFGLAFFHEALTPIKIAGILAIVAGVAALRH